MAGRYRPVDRDQAYLVPPSMAEWLPHFHPVWFVIELIEDMAPDLARFHRREVLGGTGRASFDPIMLVTLLVYACWQGVRSSRQIEARCHTDVAFRIICAQDPPDHTTISRFRQVNASAFTDLFTQVLLVCAREGMGRFGKVAIDGTKIAANASKAANVSLARARTLAKAEVEAGLAADADVDTDVDAPPPPRLRDRSHRVRRLRQVAAELEAEQADLDAAAAAARQAAVDYTAAVAAGVGGLSRPPRGVDAVGVARSRLERARADQQAKIDAWEAEKSKPLIERSLILAKRPAPVDEYAPVRRARQALARAERAASTTADQTPPSAQPAQTPKPPQTNQPKQARRNTTDPDSRIMPTKDGWVQGYNTQLAVTEDHLIIAVDVTTSPNDIGQAIPMMDKAQAAARLIATETGRDDTTIGLALMDAGYNSDDNLTAPGPDRLIATGKRRTHEHAAATNPTTGPPPPNLTPRQAMRHRLQTPDGIRAYRKRGAIVEPVNGHLKDITGLRRLLTRGLTNITAEIHLAAATLNMRRLWTYIAQAATA